MQATIAPATTTAPASLTNDDLALLERCVAEMPVEQRPQQLPPDQELQRARVMFAALKQGRPDLAEAAALEFGCAPITLTQNQAVEAGQAVLPAGATAYVDKNVALQWIQRGVATSDDARTIAHLRVMGLEKIRFPRGGSCSVGVVPAGGFAWVPQQEARALVWKDVAEPAL